jgi:hypothetical protein
MLDGMRGRHFAMVILVASAARACLSVDGLRGGSRDAGDDGAIDAGGDATANADAPEAASDAADAADAAPRTVTCGDGRCNLDIGEGCCVSGSTFRCAKTCTSTESRFNCIAADDCSGGLVCCFTHEGNNCVARSIDSQCVARANCRAPCEGNEGGTQSMSCHPASTTECLAGTKCTFDTGFKAFFCR